MTHNFSFTSSMLAFARSLEISEGLMEGIDLADPKAPALPLLIEPKGVRGQTSNDTPADGKINAGLSNPQVVEAAVLPKGATGLRIRFSLTVVPNAKKPCAVGRQETGRSYAEFFQAYAQTDGPRILAVRYLTSIAAGTFAWRNRTIGQNPKVTISLQGNNAVTFDCTRLPAPLDFTQESLLASVVGDQAEGSRNLTALLDSFVEGLVGKTPAFFTVAWQAEVPEFSQVFPSQEYVASSMQNKDISRVLASIDHKGKRLASIHSQKIGAAVRMIDTWHGHPEFGAVPVNPYAGVQEANVALRHNTSAPNLYTLMRKPDAMVQSVLDGAPNDDAHFFVANLIRGGVYGSTDPKESDASKKKNKAAKDAANA